MRLNILSPLSAGLIFTLAAGLAQAEIKGVLLLPVQALNATDEGAEHLLKRMAKAMQTTNYEGLLLHMRGGETRSMRVVHRYDVNLGRREHLFSLDGKPFEVLQDAKGCTCVWPQARYVVVGQSPAFNARFSTEGFAETRSLSEFYAITRHDYARVGGIACRLVKLVPKDNYRFGYRLCIHEPSAILLNLEVFDGERRLELNQFTQLRIPKNDDVDDMRLLTNIEGFRVVEDKRSAPVEPSQAVTQRSWIATQLPPGYLLRSADLRSSPRTQQLLEQQIFSDGLGSVSVFIERLDDAGQAATLDTAKTPPRGVMQRVARDAQGYRLTAVGDAPEATMRMLLEGMQPVPDRP